MTGNSGDSAGQSVSSAANLRQLTVAWAVAGIGGGAALIVSMVLAAMGAQPLPLHKLSVGEAFDAGRWSIRVTDARFVSANPEAKQFHQRKDSLTIDMEFTNQSAAPSNSYRVISELQPAGEGRPSPVFILARDGSIAGSLNPGMSEFVTGYWQWPDGGAKPANVRLVVTGETFRERDNLLGAPGWFPTEPVAEIQLPVKAAAR